MKTFCPSSKHQECHSVAHFFWWICLLPLKESHTAWAGQRKSFGRVFLPAGEVKSWCVPGLYCALSGSHLCCRWCTDPNMSAQVPGVYFLTTYWRNDLFGLYCGMAIGYLVLMLLYGYITITRYDLASIWKHICRTLIVSCLPYLVCFCTSDWKRYAEIARERSEMSGDPVAS